MSSSVLKSVANSSRSVTHTKPPPPPMYYPYRKIPDHRRRFIHSVGDGFSLFVWLVAGGWCWFVLRGEYCWLVAGGWFVVREKYCWLVADKPSEQADSWRSVRLRCPLHQGLPRLAQRRPTGRRSPARPQERSSPRRLDGRLVGRVFLRGHGHAARATEGGHLESHRRQCRRLGLTQYAPRRPRCARPSARRS
jgi:hypothetical protein